MRQRIRIPRRSIASTVVIAVGVVAGGATAAWSTAAAGSENAEPAAVFDATHLPPLLTIAGERAVLAYEVHCAAAGDESVDADCDAHGAVFVRSIGDTAYERLALQPHVENGTRQLAAAVPDRFGAAGRGIEYYAVLDASDLGEQVTLPAGGEAAPHVSRPLTDAVTVDLGLHAFGRDRRASTRVAAAGWGDRAGQVGLERGRNIDPIGGSAFDVDARGAVVLLDQVNRRFLRFSRGRSATAHVPVSVNGTLADMALAGDGSVFVLETTSTTGRHPLIRRFDDGGRELEAIESAERTPSEIRIDERGPVVLGRPSHHWMPVLIDGVPASPRRQLERGRPGRRVGGSEVVVLRHQNEVRLALIAGNAVTRSWRVRSATPFAEVQLADTWGQRAVVVVRMYDDTADEFAVLVLGRGGLVDRFTVDSADWAEAAPLGRFELVGRSLYRLGSAPSGVFVDRFELEVR